jgi:hypothetical protein
VGVIDDENRRLSASLAATVTKMTENAALAALREQVHAMESVIFSRLYRAAAWSAPVAVVWLTAAALHAGTWQAVASAP